MNTRWTGRNGFAQAVAALALGVSLLANAPRARCDELDELSLEGWKELGEKERYQLQVAEKFWREQNFKSALSEYEKFVELYEKSNGAPFAQLKWSLCLVKLRKQNTAIKDGFQTVVDYWPDTPQATAAAYYIGAVQRDIGRVKEAKASLKKVVAKNPEGLAAVYALNDLAAIAEVEKDDTAKVDAWRKLTFEIKRTPSANGPCVQASQRLADHCFRTGAFDEGAKALATTYTPEQLPTYVGAFARQPLTELVAAPETKAQADKLADQAVAWLKNAAPADRSTDAAKQAAKAALLAAADLTAVAKRDDQVPAAYEVALQNLPGDDEPLARLAAWWKTKNDHEKARAAYRRYADANEGLGQVAYSHRERQDWAPAVQIYQQLIGQDEKRRPYWKSQLAMAFREQKQWPQAIAVYEELFSEDKKNANQWRWEIGVTHRDAGQYAEAIGNFRQCTNFPENYKQMAACHRALKQFDQAVTVYNQITAGDKANAPWAMLQIGYTREEAEQKEAAIVAFQQVCKKHPKDGHASVAHAHLQQKYKISVTLGGAEDE